MARKKSDPFVSFIIPTIGRESLSRTLISLAEQTAPNWEAILVPDIAHVRPAALKPWTLDPRISVALADEEYSGSAGELRNLGITHARGQWVAFVDDDDSLTENYVEHLAEHAADFPRVDVVVFRMDDPRLGILPPPKSAVLRYAGVGISYAVKAHVMRHYKFVREDVAKAHHEDWVLLDELRNKHEIYISPYVDYLVRDAGPSVETYQSKTMPTLSA